MPTMIQNDEGPSQRKARSLGWILASFAFLVAGLVGGTILLEWKPEWVWLFPVAGFIGYVLAFWRGMLLWNPNIDRTWRQYFWLGCNTASKDSQPANGRVDPSEAAKNLRLVRPEPPHPPRHELRVVR